MHVTGITDVQLLIKKYFLDAYGMNETTCGGGDPNPCLAVCLQTTGYDYSKFLLAQLGNTVLSPETVSESEKSYTDFIADDYQLYGKYGFGHFLECFDSIDGFTLACAEAHNHIDPGAFGFFPLIDRKNNYYMQIVAFEASNVTYPRSGIPEYLRFLIKPIIDDIMTGKQGN